MADNVELNAMSGGEKVATDDDGTNQHQYVKLEYGGDGEFIKVSGTSGVPVMNDDTNFEVLLGASTAAIGTVTANAGTNLDTSALATESGGNLDIIAGDTTSIDGKITACNTGAVAGTVTANAGTNLNTSSLATESGGNLDTIAGDTTSLDSKVTACDTGAVLIASSNAAIGKLASNSGVDIGDVTINAGTAAIGSVIIGASDAVIGTVTSLLGTSNAAIGSVVASLAASNNVIGTVFIGASDADIGGVTVEAQSSLWSVTSNFAAAQTATRLKHLGSSGNSLYVTDVIFSVGTSGYARLVEETDGASSPAIDNLFFSENGGAVMNFNTPIKIGQDNDIGITSTIGSNHSITVSGYETT